MISTRRTAKSEKREASSLRSKAWSAWNWVVDTSLVLWICRVSLLSVLAGFALFLLVPQAQDTFLEVRGDSAFYWKNVVFWAIFFFFVVIFWALPVHYCARRDITFDPINTDPERRLTPARRPRVEQASIWVPRILGAACLLAVALGAFLASAGLRVPAAEFLYHQAHRQSNILGAVALALMAGLFYLLIKRQKITEGLQTKWFELDSNFGRSVLLAMTVLFFALLLLPISLVENLSRAPLIPLLLGGWVPVLAWLALKGRIYRAPFIVALFLGLELLTFAGNNHDIRTLAIDSQARHLKNADLDRKSGAQRMRLDEQIAKWKDSVGCNPKDVEPGSCPVRPIIVAASGGASRAGFFTAAVLGQLIDMTTKPVSLHRDFRQQLFAISSVSGSSTGAAFFIAAILDSKDGEPPCRQDKPSTLVHLKDAPKTWRHCMETLLSGDFLSSTLFAYMYKDALRGVAAMASARGYAMPDRATILEESWEKHYCAYTEGACKDDPSGLSRLFLGVAGVRQKASDGWVPLLFFNTTDVDTGRRVIISPVGPKTCPGDKPGCRDEIKERVFPDAYDLHQLLADKPGDEGRDYDQPGVVVLEGTTTKPVAFLLEDIRLSTAAGLSARFPFVSPPGNVKNRKGGLVARIVDGGYFENFGAATALDIASRLSESGLDPVIIEITNDPELLGPLRVDLKTAQDQLGDYRLADDEVCPPPPSVSDPVCATEPPVIEASSSLLFSGVRGPLSGIFGARAAQGGRALHQLANSANTSEAKRNGCPPKDWSGPDDSFVHFFVRPQYVYSKRSDTCEMVNVSMSWWLSKPVQAYLDDQIRNDDMTRATRFMEYGRQLGQ